MSLRSNDHNEPDYLEPPDELDEIEDLIRTLRQVGLNYLDRPSDYRGPQIREAVREACGSLTLGWDDEEAAKERVSHIYARGLRRDYRREPLPLLFDRIENIGGDHAGVVAAGEEDGA